jgi:hypothetical protein
VWAEAAKWLAKFDEAVSTVLDTDGYPVSIRVDTRSYDAATGQLPAELVGQLGCVEGPANLLCHYHDEKMWNIKAIQIKGRIEKRNSGWVFQSTVFNAPSKLAMVSALRGASTSAQKYLDKRGLTRPAVNWVAIREIQHRASQQR